MSESRVVLFSGDECSLCDDAVAMLGDLKVPFALATDAQYAERVPVITVDGKIVTEGRVSRRAVVAALKRRA